MTIQRMYNFPQSVFSLDHAVQSLSKASSFANSQTMTAQKLVADQPYYHITLPVLLSGEKLSSNLFDSHGVRFYLTLYSFLPQAEWTKLGTYITLKSAVPGPTLG